MNKNFERGMTEQFTVHLHLCENPLLHKEERRGNVWLILEIVDKANKVTKLSQGLTFQL